MTTASTSRASTVGKANGGSLSRAGCGSGAGEPGPGEAVSGVHEISPQMAAEWVRSGEARLVDVREADEHEIESIQGSEHVPLSRFDAGAVQHKCGGVRAVFFCRTGHRSRDAAERFGQIGQEAFALRGGLEGWKAAGHPVSRSACAPPRDVQRQTQVVAGSLVLLGVVLGVLVSPWALVLSGFVGGGLIVAGASGWCGVSRLLARMPWNQTET